MWWQCVATVGWTLEWTWHKQEAFSPVYSHKQAQLSRTTRDKGKARKLGDYHGKHLLCVFLSDYQPYFSWFVSCIWPFGNSLKERARKLCKMRIIEIGDYCVNLSTSIISLPLGNSQHICFKSIFNSLIRTPVSVTINACKIIYFLSENPLDSVFSLDWKL